MLLAVFPTAVLMSFIFVRVDFGAATTAYYAVICILFYIFYYTYLVPYDSLGAELTVDYNARTRIRSLCTVILYISIFVGGTLVMYVQQGFANARIGGNAGSWSLAVLLTCALPMLVCGLIAWRATRGKEPIAENPGETQKGENIFKSYISVLKIKPFIGIALWSLLYFIGNTVLAGGQIYLGVYVLGLSQTVSSTYFTIGMIVTIAMAVPANWLSNKMGKKNALLAAICVYIVVGLYELIKGPSGYVDGVVMSVGYGITNSIALIASYSMVYDIGELNEFKTGDSKVAACIGVYTFGMGVAQAIGYSLIGFVLQRSGFDASASVQSASVVSAITNIETLLPVIFLVLSALAIMIFYKITPKNFAALVEALEAKKEGRDYSTEGFKELL